VTWADLWRTIATSAVGALVSAAVGLYARHIAKRRREQLLRIVDALDGAMNREELLRILGLRKEHSMNLREYRKGIAVGAGSLLGGLLIYAESADLEPVLGPLVPHQYRPLVGWLIGAAVTVGAVIAARNDPKRPSLDEAPAADPLATSPAPHTLDEPAPPAPLAVPTAAGDPGSAGTASAAAAAATPPATAATAAAAAPYWAGIKRGEPQASTSLVELQPVPQRRYQ
jgi:hypothetical protein